MEGSASDEYAPALPFPEVGEQDAYLLYHELESLCQNIPGLQRIRFWMTFSERYLTHLRVLENVGMTAIEPIEINGQSIAPIEFLKAVLPDPASLGPRTKGKTRIGCDITGIKDMVKPSASLFIIAAITRPVIVKWPVRRSVIRPVCRP